MLCSPCSPYCVLLVLRWIILQGMSDALDEVQRRTGLDIGIHVDAASGAFVAPFLQPNLRWDFRVSRVVSISASGAVPVWAILWGNPVVDLG